MQSSRYIKWFLIAALSLAAANCLWAQEPQQPTPPARDSVVYHLTAQVDSTFVGESILNLLPSKVKGDAADIIVNQSERVNMSLRSYIQRNKDKALIGYRVRIFFDNKQSARVESEAAMETFNKNFHGIPAYRSYQSPFFKVTVGDFRTKSEAMVLLHSLKSLFPAAFIVKEAVNYPAADKDNTYTVDVL